MLVIPSWPLRLNLAPARLVGPWGWATGIPEHLRLPPISRLELMGKIAVGWPLSRNRCRSKRTVCSKVRYGVLC